MLLSPHQSPWVLQKGEGQVGTQLNSGALSWSPVPALKEHTAMFSFRKVLPYRGTLPARSQDGTHMPALAQAEGPALCPGLLMMPPPLSQGSCQWGWEAGRLLFGPGATAAQRGH